MRQHLKRMVWLFVALMLICTPVTAGAVESAPVFTYTESMVSDLTGESPSTFAVQNAQYTTNTKLGNQLQGDARRVYDELVAKKDYIPLNADWVFEMSYTSTAYTSVFNYDADLAAAAEPQMTMILDAAAAFRYDHPEYWMLGNYMSVSTRGEGELSGNRYKWTLYYELTINGLTDVAWSKYNAGIQDALGAVDTSNRYNTVRSVHDYLCRQITYGYGIRPYSAYDALVTGQCVCEGYAKAFKILMDKYGIPCVLVRGNADNGVTVGGHMWNYVQMEDGQWYGVDVTWGDTDYNDWISDEYFLQGSNVFNRDHYPDGSITEEGYVFAYPKLATNAYPHTHEYETVITPPTCQARGYTTYVCKLCGFSNSTDYTETLPHTFSKNHACTVCGAVDPALLQETVYSDVVPGSWYQGPVYYAHYNGMMNGMSPGQFEPDGDVSRAMIVTVLWRLEGTPMVSDTGGFSDVEPNRWYTIAAGWAAENGIIRGYSSTEFAPEDVLTREQMTTILYRYTEYLNKDTSVAGEVNSFRDGNDVSGWAMSGMRWALGSGLINGMEGLLNPKGTATRAQLATVFMRYTENVIL